MGNQCCGNQPLKDTSEMAFASSIPVRLTKKVENESSRFFQILVSKTEQPSKQLNMITEDKNLFNTDRTEEFILTIKPYSNLESPDSISIHLKSKTHDYSYKSDVEWKIDEDVIVDPNNFETSILRVVEKKSGERSSIKVINFDDYEDYKFKSALYEIYILQQLQQNLEHTDFLVQLKDAYILESEDKDHHKGSLIMIFEHCDSTLHEIIAFRKFHEWKWTDAEISSIFSDLAVALGQLESLNIVHRDIRPHNIWYCSQSHRYKIGGFQDAKLVKKSKLNNNPISLGLQNIGIQTSDQDGEEMLNTVRGVPDFLSPEVAIYLESSQPVGKYNPFLLDIYQLGLCISMMQFLANTFDQQDIRNFIDNCKKQKGTDHGTIGNKSYQDLQKMMLCGNEKARLSPAELALFVTSLNSAKILINEDNLIKSMKFKKKQVGIDATKIYQLIAVAYYDLFEWEKWHEKMEEILVTYESNKDDKNQATVLFDIAQGYLEINNVHQAQEYFMKASVIYNDMGNQERKDGQVDEAIVNYQLALDCVRKAHNGEDSYEGAMMLENLGNIYRLKGDLKKARSYLEEAFRIAQQEKGEDSLEAAKVLIHLGKIYTLLADYKLALKKIKLALKIADNVQAANAHQPSFMMSNSMISTGGTTPANQGQLLKASGLSALGELQRLKGSLDKAKQNLEEALQIRQQLQGSGHLEVASTLENLGNVYFEMEDFHSAKTYYEKALVIKKNKLGEIHTEVALTLNNIGNACKHLNESEKAQKFFTDALQILQQIHGQEDHHLIGTTYGNLGILLKEQGNQKGAEHCLTKCTGILKKTMDEDHPDQQFYKNHLNEVQSH